MPAPLPYFRLTCGHLCSANDLRNENIIAGKADVARVSPTHYRSYVGEVLHSRNELRINIFAFIHGLSEPSSTVTANKIKSLLHLRSLTMSMINPAAKEQIQALPCTSATAWLWRWPSSHEGVKCAPSLKCEVLHSNNDWESTSLLQTSLSCGLFEWVPLHC